MSPSTRDGGPGGLVSCASCQLCPFPPGCLFPALDQRLAGGLPKLRRRRQVSGDTGGHRAGDRGHRAGSGMQDPAWPPAGPASLRWCPFAHRVPLLRAGSWVLVMRLPGVAPARARGHPGDPLPHPPNTPGSPRRGRAAPRWAPAPAQPWAPVQVRRAQHTVHSETKYIELAVVNDHQLVSEGWGVPGTMRWAGGIRVPPSPTWPPVPTPRQFLQLRKSVVLTSNFAKSVVNLADMVRRAGPGGAGSGGGCPRGCCPWGWPWTLGSHSQGVGPHWAYPWRAVVVPSAGGGAEGCPPWV